MADLYKLEIYGDDGTTIAETFSTDAGEPLPYLMPPENLALQEVDFLEGRATIGGLNVELVDVPTIASDQDSGYVTDVLADEGVAVVIGRRAQLMYWDGAEFKNVLNGVVSDIALHDSYSSFTLTLKDIREREQNVRLFGEVDTATVLPRGVLDGFGYNAETDSWLVEPTEPFTVRYLENVNPEYVLGTLDFPHRADRVPIWQVITPLMAKTIDAATIGSDGFWKYASIKLYWRDVGETEWNVVDNMGYAGTSGAAGTFQDDAGIVHDVRYIEAMQFRWPTDDSPRPTSGDDIEAMFVYKGPPSEDYPLHVDGTFGSVLQEIYDEIGEVYDETAVLALTEPFLARITEPVEGEGNARAWIEENIYAPLGAAPALDEDGRISPVRDAYPPDDYDFIVLNDTNCEPSPAWTHTSSDLVNIVSVKYQRLYPLPGEVDPLGEVASGDGLAAREIEATNDTNPLTAPGTALSISIFGEKRLEIASVGLSAFGNAAGEPLTGELANETGAQLAAQRAYMVTQRYLYGGQHFALSVMRSTLAGRRVGDWCTVECSWIPDYATGTRGGARRAQILRLEPHNNAWADVHLIDAGSASTVPLRRAIICTDTEDPVLRVDATIPERDDDGSITIPVCLYDPNVFEMIAELNPQVLHTFEEASGTIVADSSGNGHDSTYVGAVELGQTRIVPNAPGTCARFLGSSGEYIQQAFDDWMYAGERQEEFDPPTGDLTSETYPNTMTLLFFIKVNAGSFTLAQIPGLWQATLSGASDEVSADFGPGSGPVVGALPGGYEGDLLMVVLQKTPTTWNPGTEDPPVPGFPSDGFQLCFINGAVVTTTAAVSGGGYPGTGPLECFRPAGASDEIYAQGFAYWTNTTLHSTKIAELWERANEPYEIGDIAEGVELQYAVSDSEPPEDSPLWVFGGSRVGGGGITITPPGSIIWVRVRGVTPGRPPSAWSDAVMATADTRPRIQRAVAWLDGSYATVEWEGNNYTLGVRVYYDVHESGDTPDYSTFFDITSPASPAVQTVVIPEAMPLDSFASWVTTIKLEPYAAYPIAGDPGPVKLLSVFAPGLDQGAIEYTDSDGTTVSRILLDEDQDLPYTSRINTLSAIPLTSSAELSVTRSDGSTITLITAVL